MKSSSAQALGRFLAIDVRAYQIAYAAFETPQRFLECGVTQCKSSNVVLARMRLARILRRVRPDNLILRRVSASSSRNTRGARKMYRLSLLHARRFGVRIRLIGETQIRDHFCGQGADTKYQAALLLTKRFPQLDWKLPPPRKPWQREHPNMAIFDAAALAVTYHASTNGP